MKHFLVHDARNIRPSSVRMLLELASILDLDLWSTDVRLLYLQLSEALSGRISIENHADEFKLNKNQCLDLLKPLYDISDSSDS